MADDSIALALAAAVRAWAEKRGDVVGLALVGSHARGNARPTSDVDLVVLAEDPALFRGDRSWMAAIPWPAGVSAPGSWHDAEYGAVWSRHLHFDGVPTIEISFASPSWAATDPIDAGTHRVVSAGFRILWDPRGLLSGLLSAMEQRNERR